MTGNLQGSLVQEDTMGRAKGMFMRHKCVYVGYFFARIDDAVAATQTGMQDEQTGSDTVDDTAEEAQKKQLFEEQKLIHRLELECLDVNNDDSTSDED